MDGGDTPPAPDYTGAAQATADGNLKNLNEQTVANRPNQNTPLGSSTWTQAAPTTDQAGYDAAMATYNNQMANYQGYYGQTAPTAPKLADFQTQGQWTQNVTLTPDQQKALNDQMTVQANQSALAKQMQGQVASTMSGGFDAPQFADYMKGVNGVNQNFGSFNPSGVNGTDQNFRTGAQRVNTAIPQFSSSDATQGAQSAYDAGHSLIADQQKQDVTNLDTQLRVQGLQPGTPAYDNAMQNMQRTQAQQNNNLASSSVVTGNQMANANYASALAGYGAQNAAIGQQYNQDTNSFNTNNTAQNQAYTQALAGYGANQTALQQANTAQQQAWQQGQGNFNTAYSSALSNYLQPLNSMNAVTNGQQVQSPTMPSFASAGYTPGADMSGATNAQGSWNQGIYNSNTATANSQNTSAVAGLATIAAMYI